jgi:3-deoxy-7-phosphoheptulonate synthase
MSDCTVMTAEHKLPEPTTVNISDIPVGGGYFSVIAGPCAVESREQALACAFGSLEAGAALFRGGAYKPRTSRHSFQGLGPAGLELLAEVRTATGLPIVTELLDVRDTELVLGVADVVQIGARNMYNAPLLREVGRAGVAVLLKRGFGATIDEFLHAAEYILGEGNEDVILCERGIRTFERAYRFTLDVGAIAVLKNRTHLPVFADPSHAAGHSELVEPLALAATAAGADGLIVESHERPETALCDGEQAISLTHLPELVRRATTIAELQGKTVITGRAALADVPLLTGGRAAEQGQAAA